MSVVNLVEEWVKFDRDRDLKKTVDEWVGLGKLVERLEK